MNRLTKADAARHLNVSRTTIYNMINRGVLTPDDLGFIDVAQLDKSFTRCTGERQEKNTNVPVEFREASPLVMKRYVSFLEQELIRVRADNAKYISYLEEQVAFLQNQNKVLQLTLLEKDKELDKIIERTIENERAIDKLLGKLQTVVDHLEMEKKPSMMQT